MLTKQGIFNRGQKSQENLNANHDQTYATQSAQKLQNEHDLMPGHLAAIASATKTLINSPSFDDPSPEVPIIGIDIAPSRPAAINRLLVGPDVKLKGAEIDDCDTLVVEGRVDAIMDSRVIQISEKGSFTGKVGIDIAEIRGFFDGELTARDQLIIYATGKVSGKIRYGKIHIEEGGELTGDVASIKCCSENASQNNLKVNANG
jgi:cytoskeletal protein CcmA (bactofilin family)